MYHNIGLIISPLTIIAMDVDKLNKEIISALDTDEAVVRATAESDLAEF